VARTQDSQLARLVAAELYAGRPVAYGDELEKKVAALTAEEVNAAIKKHLQPKKLKYGRAISSRPRGNNEVGNS
jgi:zinc protease